MGRCESEGVPEIGTGDVSARERYERGREGGIWDGGREKGE